MTSRPHATGCRVLQEARHLRLLQVAERAELGTGKAWQVLVVVPAQEVFIPLEIGTPVLFEDSKGYKTLKLSQVFPRMEVPLKKLIEVRNRIRVFADLRLDSSTRDRIGGVAGAQVSL